MNNRGEPTVNVGGTKLRVRLMKPTETIQEGDLTGYNGHGAEITEENLQCLTWKRSTQVGEKVGEYPSWVYLRVLSKFWK
jgi:hypothetical protein